ncbi:MAG: PadR family transcriptional regulator [Planctomycetota bacterium]
MKLERELMRGAGPTAVLQLLSAGEKYGYELVEALAQRSSGVLAMGQSTLYPLLYNLEAKGLVKSRVDETGPRPRRYYRLTSKGQKKLTAESRQWAALFKAFQSLDVLPGSEGSLAPGGAS